MSSANASVAGNIHCFYSGVTVPFGSFMAKRRSATYDIGRVSHRFLLGKGKACPVNAVVLDRK